MAEQTYSRTQVESWQSQLEEIAVLPRTTFTKRQVVEELIDTIEKALSTRSYAEVAESLSEWGLEISAGALKQYVSRYRSSLKRGHSGGGKKRRSPAAAASSTATAGKKSAGKAGKQVADKSASQATNQSASQADSRTAVKGNKDRDVATESRRVKPGRFLDMPDDL